jgi:hypothetical protein
MMKTRKTKRQSIRLGIEPDQEEYDFFMTFGDWRIFEQVDTGKGRWVNFKVISTKPVGNGLANCYLSFSETERRFAHTKYPHHFRNNAPGLLEAIVEKLDADSEAWQKENQ